MDTPTISRSGRLVKKSAKVKEMEDFDITDLESVGSKPRKKSKSDEFDDFDEKRIQPIKIPKISLNVSSASTSFSMQSSKKKTPDSIHTVSKIPPFPSPVKSKLDPNRPLFQESSPETSKDFGSSSMSSETSSTSSSSTSSSDDSEGEYNVKSRQRPKPTKMTSTPVIPKIPVSQEKVIVESYKQFNSPLTFVDPSADLNYESEEETSEPNLVIAEESNDSSGGKPKDKKASISKRKIQKKPAAKSGQQKPRAPKRKLPAAKDGKPTARKKSDPNKDKKVTAYMLWCSENRKRIVAQNPVLFSSISKKMGEIWQALPEKEKMAWRRKAKKVCQKGAELISTGRPTPPPKPSIPSICETLQQLNSTEAKMNIGTSPIDVAAYLKLLGESLSIIGQRLTEHEGQIAVSGIFSVLLDSTLCALGPLLCLTSETEELNGCPQPVHSKILDNIAYFMPGL